MEQLLKQISDKLDQLIALQKVPNPIKSPSPKPLTNEMITQRQQSIHAFLVSGDPQFKAYGLKLLDELKAELAQQNQTEQVFSAH
jgi:hypothetical protein